MMSGICCSFCGKPQEAVDRLIAGHGVYICNECVELCMTIIEPDVETEVRRRPVQKDSTPPALPTPHEIKERLDQYVIGQDEAKIALSVAVYNHYKREWRYPEPGDDLYGKSGIAFRETGISYCVRRGIDTALHR